MGIEKGMISTGVPEDDRTLQLFLCSKVNESSDGFGAVDRIYQDTFRCGEKIYRLHYPWSRQPVTVPEIVLGKIDVLTRQLKLRADQTRATLRKSEVLAWYIVIYLSGDDDAPDRAWRAEKCIAQY